MKRFFALVGLTIVGAAGATSCGVFKKGKAEGQIESKGGALGDWTMTTGVCYSGQRENYFGVIAFGPDENGQSIKLVKDSVTGWNAVVNIPSTCAKQAEATSCRAVPINETDCDVFKASVTRTNTTVNDVRKLDGTLTLDCSLENGGTLKGKMSFDGCH